jgi:hypothetical protein
MQAPSRDEGATAPLDPVLAVERRDETIGVRPRAAAAPDPPGTPALPAGEPATSSRELHLVREAARLLGLIVVLLLATLSDLTLALYQGFLFADLMFWALTAGFDLAARKALGVLEGIGYLLLVWLFFRLGNGRWLPEDPTCLGLAFLSFLMVFLGKITWWSHRNLIAR